MPVQFITPTIFALLALIFGVLAYRSYRRDPSQSALARKAWVRIAVIFGLVSGCLYVFGWVTISG